MNKLLLLNSFVGGLEKLAQDRDSAPSKSSDEKEVDQAGSVLRAASATKDAINKEKKRIGRGRVWNQMKPKMFRSKPSGLVGTAGKAIESANRVMNNAQRLEGKRKYDDAETVGRAVAKASQMTR